MQRILAQVPIVALLLAPAVCGCHPAWAWGVLLAIVFVCAAAALAFDAFQGRATLRSALFSTPQKHFAILAILLLGWASITVIYDHVAGPPAGRYPVLSLQSLLYVLGFAAAFVCGLEVGLCGARVRQFARLFMLAAALYSTVTVLQWLGVVPNILGLTWLPDPLASRPSGTYPNANRFAVFLSMGWSITLGTLACTLFPRRKPLSLQRLRRWLGRHIPAVMGLGVIAAGLCMTFSRLTYVATALGLGLACSLGVLLFKQVPGPVVAFNSALRVKRILVVAALSFLVAGTLFLLGGLAVSGRAMGTRLRVLLAKSSSDVRQRCLIWETGLQIASEHPWLGIGLGAFETVASPRQPLELPQRWDYLHNDWLGLAVELGYPAALACLVAMMLWWRIWWAATAVAARPRALFLLGGGMALFVPLVCSLADYPLREPANGILFFFLAGLLRGCCKRWDVPPPTTRRTAPPRWSILAALTGSAVFVVAAWFSGQVALAAAGSPWFGHMMPPHADARDADGYRSGLKWNPDDPALLMAYTQCQVLAFRSASGPEWLFEQGRTEAALAALHRTQPHSHVTVWLEASFRAEQGKIEEAVDLLDRAAELAPANRHLRHKAAQARIAHILPAQAWGSMEREACLVRALAHLKTLLELEPGREQGLVTWLSGAGLSTEEVAKLWEGLPCGRLRQAKYLMAHKDLAAVNALLERMDEHDQRSAWFLAVRGRLDLESERIPAGIAAWKQMLEQRNESPDDALDAWLAHEMSSVPEQALTALALGCQNIIDIPSVTLGLAWRLGALGNFAAAQDLLQRLIRERPSAEAYHAAAELAMRSGDRRAALGLAFKAWEHSDRSAPWRDWKDKMDVNCKAP